jgi:mRNA interferase MazF
VTVCPLTSDPTDLPLLRVLVASDQLNGLHVESRIMADKVTTLPKSKLRQQIGRLGDDDLGRLERALIVFLGLAA